MSRLSAELAYLKKLIKDFPPQISPGKVEEAYKKIAARYQFIEQDIVYQTPFALYDSQIKKRALSNVLKERALMIHNFLFNGVLSNAGEVRKRTDPGGGRIYFEGQRHQQQRARFEGVAPDRIEQELIKAFANLVSNPDDPVEQAFRFYQHFVKIHPFYDANGRIGRIVVSIYLNMHEYYVFWAKFDGPNNAEFIKKLNECHKRRESGYGFKEYFHYLLSFVRKHIVSLDELNSLG